MRAILVTGLVCVMAATAMVSSLGAQGGGGAQAPLQNLQVLPETMTRQEVTAFMRSVTAALGVECSHCHVGTPADRAKDDKPEKAMARQMIRLSLAINNDLLKDIGTPPAGGALRVTCYTCHRGSLKVATAPAVGGGL